ncbi:hypothetical protein MXC99_06385, partial [Thauera aromatica]|uniref:hypothetical protein n=1 Tax=Thauera aromatica TaxID=59405 RepID=UPI001FFD630A
MSEYFTIPDRKQGERTFAQYMRTPEPVFRTRPSAPGKPGGFSRAPAATRSSLIVTILVVLVRRLETEQRSAKLIGRRR